MSVMPFFHSSLEHHPLEKEKKKKIIAATLEGTILYDILVIKEQLQ